MEESILERVACLTDVFQSAVRFEAPRYGLTREAVHVPVLLPDV